jgi:hypothetical protein
MGREIVGPGYSEAPSTGGVEASKGRHEPRMKVTRGVAYPTRIMGNRFGGQSGEGRHSSMDHLHGTVAEDSTEAGSRRARSVKAPKPWWCPTELSKIKHRRLQKLRKKEMEAKKAEDVHDEWFNRAWPMTSLKKTWRERRLAREEHNGEDTDHESGENTNVNMVFVLLAEFRALEKEIAELVLGAKKASFDKPEKLGHHMRPLFVQGHIDGRPMQRIMVGGGVGVNVMPFATFKRMGY